MNNWFKKKPKKKQHSASKQKPKVKQPVQQAPLAVAPQIPKLGPELWKPPFQENKSPTSAIPPLDLPFKAKAPDFPKMTYRKPPQKAKKDFLDTFHKLTGRWRAWQVWSDFIVMTACVISNSFDTKHEQERAKRYLQVAEKYTTQELDLFPELFAHLVLALEEDPEQDFLGNLYTEMRLNDERTLKQIFTPYSVADMMSRITLTDLAERVEKEGFVTIDDCCCGTGGNLIAAANESKVILEKAGYNYQNHILITGQDIDEIMALSCYIQISLLGVAGYFKVGDTLRHPMSPDDDTDDYWYTPMFFFPVWQWRRIFHALDVLTAIERLELDEHE